MPARAIERLTEAIGYPERVPAGAASFTLQVDGGEIQASETGNALRLVCRLTDDAAQFPRLAEYAAGRMLREDAALACDQEGAFLWQETSATGDAQALQGAFETFCDSCDWWRARVLSDSDGNDIGQSPDEMRILP